MLKYRVIKKSLCTWRLYCNNQVHRDFLIILYLFSKPKKLFLLWKMTMILFCSSIYLSGLVENDLPVIYFFYSYIPYLSCKWKTEFTKTVHIIFRRVKYYYIEVTNSHTKSCMWFLTIFRWFIPVVFDVYK